MTANEDSLQAFGRQLDAAYRKKVVGRLMQVQRTIAITGYQWLITDSRTVGLAHGSPVWTGRYRGSIRIALENRDPSVAPPMANPPRWPEEPASPIRARPMSEAARVLAQMRPFGRVVLSNSLPYARRIEFGHSKLKAPNGVFRVTAMALNQRFGGLIRADVVM